MPTSAYIHIPFCKSKCKYCSFVSFVNEEKILGYVYSLLKDIDTNYQGEKLRTLYFGGGTPSLLKTGRDACHLAANLPLAKLKSSSTSSSKSYFISSDTSAT